MVGARGFGFPVEGCVLTRDIDGREHEISPGVVRRPCEGDADGIWAVRVAGGIQHDMVVALDTVYCDDPM